LLRGLDPEAGGPGGPGWVITRYDKILAGIIVFAALIGFLFFFPSAPQSGTKVIVEAGGREVYVFLLKELEPGKRFPIKGPLGNSILEMGENRVRLVDSPCPDHICLARGWIAGPGEMIICMPNKVVVRIEGEKGWDDIVR